MKAGPPDRATTGRGGGPTLEPPAPGRVVAAALRCRAAAVPPPQIIPAARPSLSSPQSGRSRTAPSSQKQYLFRSNPYFKDEPGAQTGHFAPGNRYSLLPGANTGLSAPDSGKNRIPGAKWPVFAPGKRYFLSPGAGNSLFAPGKLPKSNGERDWETAGWHWGLSKASGRSPTTHFGRVGNSRIVPEFREGIILFPTGSKNQF